jgi:hypothetical protein
MSVQSKVRITPIKDQQREGERELSIPEAELKAAYLSEFSSLQPSS